VLLTWPLQPFVFDQRQNSQGIHFASLGKQTLSFWYELLGSIRSVNRSRSRCFKNFRSCSRCLKSRSRSREKRGLKTVTMLIWQEPECRSGLRPYSQSIYCKYHTPKWQWQNFTRHVLLSEMSGVTYFRLQLRSCSTL